MDIIKFQKAKLERNQLIIDEDTSLDEWKELGQLLKQVEGSVQFWIGDWARFGEKKGFTGKYVAPQVYDELEELTGYSRDTLKHSKSVSEKVPTSARLDDLSYSHHVEVAPLPPEEQAAFLQKASDEHLSVRELRDEIKSQKGKKEVLDEQFKVQQEIHQKMQREAELYALAKDLKSRYNKQEINFLIHQLNK